jgi:hypothetical protein
VGDEQSQVSSAAIDGRCSQSSSSRELTHPASTACRKVFSERTVESSIHRGYTFIPSKTKVSRTASATSPAYSAAIVASYVPGDSNIEADTDSLRPSQSMCFSDISVPRRRRLESRQPSELHSLPLDYNGESTFLPTFLILCSSPHRSLIESKLLDRFDCQHLNYIYLGS